MAKKKARRKPPRTQERRTRPKRDAEAAGYWDVTHQPLQCLAFLLPLVLLYEFGMALAYRHMPFSQRPDLASRRLLDWFFSLFGVQSLYLPGLLLVFVLLAWQIASRFPWRVSLRPVVGMYAESLLLAVPLLLLNNWIPSLSSLTGAAPAAEWSGVFLQAAQRGGALDVLLLSVGAGIYEELVFRLIFITLITMLLADVVKMRQMWAVAAAVIISSLLFAAHHYEPIGSEPWAYDSFAFRSAAGAYLAAVFVLRGFGLAVGCHIFYDVLAYVL